MNTIVSIIIITYNSSKYVLETLESAKAQIYQNIELIVSDDCSTDNTVEICREWIEENRERFIKTELITVGKNTGISPNCNRGVRAAQGEWIKLVAGDDILTNNCVLNFMEYSKRVPEAKLIFGSSIPFLNDIKYKKIFVPQAMLNGNAKEQHDFLLKKTYCMLGPVGFLKKSVIYDLNMYDERIPFMEDYPMWLKATQKGNRLYFIDFVTSYYRIHEDGLCSSSNFQEVNPKLLESKMLATKLYVLPMLLKRKFYLHFWHVTIMNYFSSKRPNSRILKKVSYLVNPWGVYIKCLRKLKVEYEFKFELIIDK